MSVVVYYVIYVLFRFHYILGSELCALPNLWGAPHHDVHSASMVSELDSAFFQAPPPDFMEKTKPEVLCRDGMAKHLYGASLQMAPQMFSRFVATLSIVLVRDWKAKVEERETTKTGKERR